MERRIDMKAKMVFLILVLMICVALIIETIYSALAGYITDPAQTVLAFSGMIFIGFLSVMLIRVMVMRWRYSNEEQF